jgi:hypothetical protein
MFRRILVTGLGGLAGLGLWVLVATDGGTDLPPEPSEGLLGTVACCVLIGGLLFMFLGEALHLIPSQESLDEQSKPMSLLSVEDRNPKP